MRQPTNPHPRFRHLWHPALLLALVLLALPATSPAAQPRVAVASNFAGAMKQIAARYETETTRQVTLIFGATGKHYAQIHNGAPFDLFFAADTLRPYLLAEEGVAVPNTRFTYAMGQLILWSPQPGLIDPQAQLLAGPDFRHLAVANPRLAPYGAAARAVLESRGLWHTLQGRLVQGENIGQTLQFVTSGNAELGFVALSQVQRPDHPLTGSWWLVPPDQYPPITQQAVLLRDSPEARDFLAFCRGPSAREILLAFGYGVP